MEQSNKKVITDEEVIKMLYQSKALENYNKSELDFSWKNIRNYS